MIELVNDQRIHVFECNAGRCRGKGKNEQFVRRNLSTSDATSTSNLRKHATLCWGKEVVDAAKAAGSALEARQVLKRKDGLRDGSIAVEFARAGEGKPTYSTRPPTKLESRTDHVRWMAESKRPFNLVKDRGYHRVMKNGRPAHYIPSDQSIGRDLRQVFIKTRERIAKKLQVSFCAYLVCIVIAELAMRLWQEQESRLNFGIDAWTSPNSRAYVAITVHYEANGKAETYLLDIVEVAMSHTGVALATALTKVLKNFGISDKVRLASMIVRKWLTRH